ncbi:aldehyde dehydrogenase [Rhodococcus sp. NPDC127530]|uniref:aldehyde dehydrogenase n=1 Tax=unclassified Rhodococcus (in: high G+C Gram-positive bacteria) TaxID=192944 RepID=UPI00362A1DB5
MTKTISEFHDLFVGGEWVSARSEHRFEVISPATEELIATVALPSIEDAEAAVSAAREAFERGEWSGASMEHRADVLGRFCDLFDQRRTDWTAAWVAESGPTRAHSDFLNDLVIGIWRDIVETAKRSPVVERRTYPDGTVDIVAEPYGVAVTITTWNGPALYLVSKIVPALLAGCSVIVKTAVESQLTARIIGELANEAGIPAGVLSVLAAPTDVSAHLVAHPDVDKVSLTGSVAAGKSVMAACANNLTPVTLELGGKSPAIIADDIALDKVLPTLLPAFFMNAGQICVALTRLIIPKHRHDEIVEAVVEGLSQVRVGSPEDPASVIGPIGTRAQYEKVLNFITSGKEDGATLVCGGGRPAGLDRGFFIEPTVFSNVTPTMRIAREEIFGPVLSIMTYEDIDEAVEIANSTPFGLAGTVYAADENLARNVADRIRSGTVAVNTIGPSLYAPFGGYKESGFGRENGREGIREFQQLKSIKIA